MNKRHYEHTLPNIRGSLSNTYIPFTKQRKYQARKSSSCSVPGLTCMKMADGFWAMKEKSMKSAILNFLYLFPTRTIRLPLWTKDFPLP